CRPAARGGHLVVAHAVRPRGGTRGRRGLAARRPRHDGRRGDRRPPYHAGRPADRPGRQPMSTTTPVATRTGLEIAGVTLVHGDGESTVTALDDVSLTVAAGEFVAVVGPSGSGKSSLLAVAGGLITPDSGRVRLGDTDLTGLSPRRPAGGQGGRAA